MLHTRSRCTVLFSHTLIVCDAVENRLCSSFAANNHCCVYSRSPRPPSSKVYLLCCSVIVVTVLCCCDRALLYGARVCMCVSVSICEYGYLGTHLFPLLHHRPNYKVYILRVRRYARNNIKKFNNKNIIIAHYYFATATPVVSRATQDGTQTNFQTRRTTSDVNRNKKTVKKFDSIHHLGHSCSHVECHRIGFCEHFIT